MYQEKYFSIGYKKIKVIIFMNIKRMFLNKNIYLKIILSQILLNVNILFISISIRYI
jgi:hypothetical protein